MACAGKPFGARLVENVLLFNPVAAALSEIRAPGFEEYTLLPNELVDRLRMYSLVFDHLAVRTWQLTRPD